MNKEQFIAIGLPEDLATKAAEASTNELKTFVPKHRFDEVSEEVKTLKGTVKTTETALDELKKSSGDAEAMKKQIETLQADKKAKDDQHKKDLQDLKLNNAIKLAVTGKAQDEDLVAGLLDKSKLILGDDGKVTGLDEQLKSLKETKAFLFKAENATPPNGFVPVGGTPPTGGSPAGGQTMSLKDAIAAQLGQQKQ